MTGTGLSVYVNVRPATVVKATVQVAMLLAVFGSEVVLETAALLTN